MEHRKRQHGFGLMEAIVSVVIVTITALAIQSVLTLSFRGSSHADLRLALRSLSETINDRVDCTKTMAQVTNPSLDCDVSSPKALLLKDASGAALTGALKSGLFSPTDSTFKGSASLGKWEIRAYCQLPGPTLYVRYAKANGSGFAVDPFNKRSLDWQNSDMNPLFGPSDRTLCSSTTGGVVVGGTPKNPIQRFAMLRVHFTVLNNTTEKLTVDLTKASPTVVAATSAKLAGYTFTEPFNTTGAIRAMTMLERVDVRNPYYNVTAAPVVGTTISSGRVTVTLSKAGDVGDSSPNPPYGTATYTVLVFQSDT